MRLIAACIAATALAYAGVGASASDLRTGVTWVPVPKAYLAQCRIAARRIGYPIPCPMRLPEALTQHQDGATPDCTVTIICPIESGPWKGWATGSVASPDQHLVITASPQPLADYARAVDGPGWSKSARVRPIAWITTGRWRMRAVFVSPQTNESAFVHHVAVIWTVGRHTYAAGFHDFDGVSQTLHLDQQLAASIQLVRP